MPSCLDDNAASMVTNGVLSGQQSSIYGNQWHRLDDKAASMVTTINFTGMQHASQEKQTKIQNATVPNFSPTSSQSTKKLQAISPADTVNI